MHTKVVPDMSTPDTLNKNTRVAAAIQAPEDAVPPPNRNRAGSFTTAVTNLDIGETATRTMEVDPGITVAAVAQVLPGLRDRLRNNVAPCVRNAKLKTGGEYSVEVSDCWTPKGRLFIVAFLTRTA